MSRLPLLAALLAGSLAGSLPLLAQDLAGLVQDFAGTPAPRAVVRVFDDAGDRLVELLTDPEGRFAYRTSRRIGHLEVQCEGVRRRYRIDAGQHRAVTCSFAGLAHFTLRGHLVDPIGAPMVGVDLQLRDALGATLVTTTTGDKGAFRVRCDQTIGSIVVDPIGLQHLVECDIGKDQGLAIDLRLHRDDFFCISGRALDADGQPMPTAVVRGADGGSTLVQRPTRSDGSFALWSRRPLTWLAVQQDGQPVALWLGDLDADRTLDIDVRRHGFAVVTGRVVDADGRSRPYVQLFAADGEGALLSGLPMLGRTEADGAFTIQVPRAAARLFLYHDRKVNGHCRWSADQPLTLTLR